MTGVEILAMEEVVASSTFNWLTFWIVVAICAGVGLVAGVIVGLIENEVIPSVVLFILTTIFGLMFGAIAGAEDSIPTEYETQYKVTISDEVPMNEFLERYEIVDQEGKIYTVREIKDGNQFYYVNEKAT